MPVGKVPATAFKPGWAGGPGRPKGSRHKLAEAFLKAIADDFEKHGEEAIQKARLADAPSYIRVIASLLPKEVTGENGAPLFGAITVKFVRPGDLPQS